MRSLTKLLLLFPQLGYILFAEVKKSPSSAFYSVPAESTYCILCHLRNLNQWRSRNSFQKPTSDVSGRLNFVTLGFAEHQERLQPWTSIRLSVASHPVTSSPIHTWAPWLRTTEAYHEWHWLVTDTYRDELLVMTERLHSVNWWLYCVMNHTWMLVCCSCSWQWTVITNIP